MKKKIFITIIFFAAFIVVILNIQLRKTTIEYSIKGKQVVSKNSTEKEYYDVTTFGANGQDSQNDALAIQEALDKAKETNSDIIVYVPEGTYYIDRQLKIYSNTTLSLNDNAVIINSTGKVQMLRTGHLNSDGTDCSGATCTHGGYTQWENITIEGGTWDFNNDGSGNSNGIYTPHGQGLTIRNATFMNSSGHTLNVSASKDILIENVIIKNQISSEPKKADDTNESIHLDSATTGGEPWAYPIDNTPIKNVTIQNCTFENVLCGIGSHLNYSDENVMEDNIIIKNNTFKDVKCYAINIYAHKNVEIYGNTATGKNTNNILSNTNEAYGFVHTYYANANIHDNKVKNFEYTVIKDTKNSEYTITCDDERICNKFFIIEYEPNGGTGTMEQTVVEYGVSKKLSKNKFKKYGYKFGGWTAHRTYPGSFTWICTDNKWYTEEEIEQNGYTKAIYKNEQGVAKTGWWHHSIVEMYAQWIKREKIEISSKPTKLTYLQNSENLDLSGGVIESTYEDGSSDTIDLTDENVHVTGFNNSKFGTQTLTVDYEGKQTTFEVTVTQKLTSTKYTVDEEQKILTDIELETTVDTFKNKINGVYNYTIKDKNGKTLANSDYIPTGGVLETSVGNYTLIVRGDLNGDGSLKLNDLAMAQKIFLELSEPENLKVKAADL
ncbi:MAG: bacterial Ig-like domain-containing protein, partial [Clostridia bacterium]|nr:bacterial Ig-like domain-containing protein [Clostridia bacterium]